MSRRKSGEIPNGDRAEKKMESKKEEAKQEALARFHDKQTYSGTFDAFITRAEAEK